MPRRRISTRFAPIVEVGQIFIYLRSKSNFHYGASRFLGFLLENLVEISLRGLPRSENLTAVGKLVFYRNKILVKFLLRGLTNVFDLLNFIMDMEKLLIRLNKGSG